MSKPREVSAVLCDLDGVVWLAHQPIPGSVEAIARLRAKGIDVLFVTNNSFSTVDEQEATLLSLGIEAAGRVLTSSMAAAGMIDPNWRVLVCGGAGLQEEISRAAGDVVVAHRSPGAMGPFDAVVVGMHREFNYEVLSDALAAVAGGARLVASNADPTYPTPFGPRPGGGSIVAAIERASGVRAIVTGKPHEPMADLVRRVLPHALPDQMMMIGDRADTDGLFARTMGCRFGLVLSGVTASAEGAEHSLVGPDLSAVVDLLLSG